MTPDLSELDVIDPVEAGVTEIADAEDPVIAAIDRVEGEYRAAREAWVRDAQEFRRVRDELSAARIAEQQAREHAHRLRAQLDDERRKAHRQKEKAAQLAAALRDVHKALFGGNVFDLILRACLSLTGATRGVYLTAWDGGPLRARAAVDVDGYPKKAPSAFLAAICDKVLNGDGNEYMSNQPRADGLPPPADDAEAFDNVLAAPAVLLKRFNGVVVLADKPGGGFDPEDVEQVLSVGDQAGVAIENRHLQDELLRAYFSVVAVLADAVDAKDPYTHGHSEQVARLSRMTAVKLAADDAVLRSQCCYGGLLHDIGKIGVSDGVLNKPGRLTPEEWTLMQSHARIGKDLLTNVPALDGVVGVVLHHHERFDGTGYPDGLAGEAIPLAARVVGVVDAYCAMTSKRSYKESATADEARAELEKCKGGHFDPRVVDAFLAVLDDPEAGDACPDNGCGLVPELEGAGDFHHVLKRPGKG